MVYYILEEFTRIIKSSLIYSNKVTSIGFRNQYYIISKIILYPQGPVRDIYINIGCSITIVDQKFIEVNLLHAEIRTIASLTIIKGLGKAKYKVNQFIYTIIYLSRKTNISEPIIGEIIVDLYIVEDLKANIFLSINIISLEEIDVITSKKYLYINSYSIRMLIKIRSRDTKVHRSIKAK